MVFITDLNGTTTLVESTPIYQGSSLANSITILCPMPRNNNCTVAFRLANGMPTKPLLMIRLNNSIIGDNIVGELNAWSVELDTSITEYAGIVDVQFYFYQGFSNGSALAIQPTFKTSFEVQPGVVPELPETPSQNIYEQLLSALTNAENKIFGKLELFSENVFNVKTWLDALDGQAGDTFITNRIDPTDFFILTNPIFNKGVVSNSRRFETSANTPDWTVEIDGSVPNGQTLLSIFNGNTITLQNTGAQYSVLLGNNVIASMTFTEDEPNVVAIAKDGTEITVYFNANVVGSATITNSGSVATINVGVNNVTYNLSTFKIYNKGISAETLYNSWQSQVYRLDKINAAEEYKLDLLLTYSQDIARILRDSAGYNNASFNNKTTLVFYVNESIVKEVDISSVNDGVKASAYGDVDLSLNDDTLEMSPKNLNGQSLTPKSVALPFAKKSTKDIVSGNGYSLAVPVNSAPYAQINKIGGMSYKDGDTLRDAKVTEVKSVGKNLFGGIALANKIKEVAPTNSVLDTSAKTIKYYAGEIQHKILFSNFKPNTRYSFLLEGSGTAKLLNLKITYTDGTTETLGSFSSADTVEPVRFVSSASKSIKNLIGEWQSGYTTLRYEKCGIFEGVVAYADFTPYTEHTIAIPKRVQSLEGYGLGINLSLYNYIDFENKKFNRVVNKVDLGTLNWTYSTGGSTRFSSTSLSNLIKATSTNVKANILCPFYNVGTADEVYSGTKEICVSNTEIWVYNPTYNNVEDFKSAMSGVMLVYELATPTTEDIPEIDNLIGVEGDGTLTFENEYGYNVPYEIEYTINSNDVIGAKEFVGNLTGTAEVAKYYDDNGNPSKQTIGEALSKLLGAGNPLKITTESIGQLSTTQVLTGINDSIVANPPVAVNDIILDRYLDGDAAYLCFWLVTAIETSGAYTSTMTLQGAGNIYVGGGSASIADRAIADGNGNTITSTYETKTEAQASHGLLASNIVTNANNISTNAGEITNIKNGTTPVGKANYADNPSGNLDTTITNILTDLASAVKRANFNTNYFDVVSDLIKVIKADSAVYASGNENAGTLDDRIRNAENLATTSKSEATIAATSASQLAGQLINRAECTYAPDYSQGGAMALKLTLYTKEGQAIQVSGFQTAIDNYFGDILV